MIDFPTLLTTITPSFLVKIALLVLLFLYMIFGIIVIIQARAFHRIVYIGDSFGSLFIQLLAIIHLVASISLFLLALAIL